MFRFLHSADLHLGKPFGRFPEDVRGRLRQARQDCLARLAQAARDQGCSHVLLAGDTFDAETPSARTLRQALNAMAGADDLTWVLLPGNHDSLRATQIWDSLAREAPPNVQAMVAAEPVTLAPGVAVLPAPCTTRDPGRDLSAWMEGAETGDALRLGLAHGPIQDFVGQEDRGDIQGSTIAPDRARRAGLDYLALGDWHGRIEVTPNTWYPGTPEADGFRAAPAPGALSVTLPGPGAPAQVQVVETGQITWAGLGLELLDQDGDAAARLTDALPPLAQRADTLLRLRLSGRASLAQRSALQAAFDAVAPDFLDAVLEADGLSLVQTTDDLALIAEGGALRQVAEGLAAQAARGDATAARALSLMFAFAQEGDAS